MTVACTGIGVAAASGIAIGDAFLLCRGPICVTPSWIPADNVEAEVSRFENALQLAADQLTRVQQEIPQDTPSEIADFINTHLLMLEDRALSMKPISLIRAHAVSAEWALQQHRDALIQVFENMEDAYLRTRRDDLDHVVNRVLGILLEQHESPFEELRGQIVLAEDLTPADVIMMKNQEVAGFITDFGGPMSHTAILARSLGIPAIVGTRSATVCLQHGERIVLDAANGVVLAECDDFVLAQFASRRDAALSRASELRRQGDRPAVTRDGETIELLANIELAEDVTLSRANGARGIGLYRTEFLYMNRPEPPTEDDHLAAYRAVVAGMSGRPVTIRTLDLGGDKRPTAVLPHGSGGNPALGLRAIRLCLKEPELFMPQLRAILRVSSEGPVNMMLPMLTTVWEVDEVLALLREARNQLDQQGIPYDPGMRIGGMIEVPAAALNATAFAKRLDFLSIGTNDLVQYTLAIDRVDDEVNYLFDPLHPAVLQLIRQVIDAGRSASVPVAMCGEMAGDPQMIPLLIGLGLRKLSMQPSALLDARETIGTLDAAYLRDRVARLFDNLGELSPQQMLQQLH